jgi:hypothetical protein
MDEQIVTIQLHNDRRHLWSDLQRAIKSCQKPAHVAVAYIGSRGAKLLPLQPESRLVVDASEASVKAGRTCPAELLTLARAGVRIYSVSNLHAKVYILDRFVYVGSANASDHSANSLVEAMLATNDPGTVADARRFVQDMCLDRLSDEALKKLNKLYRPPKFQGPKVRKVSGKTVDAEFPPLRIYQGERGEATSSELERHAIGLKEARRSPLHERRQQLESFRDDDPCRFTKRDLVVQVIEEDNGQSFVYPPGKVVHIRPYAQQGKTRHWVYLDLPKDQRRRNAIRVSKQLGRNGRKLISTQGLIRARIDAARLLRLWER